MNGPNYRISSITKLPVDILASIVLFVPGEDLGRLKMTGSKSLWHILRCPNLVKSVKLGNGGLQFKSWPAFMNEFPSLGSLRIDNESAQWWSDLGLSADQLPPTLRNLSLLQDDLKDPGHFFVNKATSDTIHLDEHLPHLQSLKLREHLPTNFDWVAYCPPSLTNLDVRYWSPEIAPPSSLLRFKCINGTPSVLPPTLESVSIEHFSHSLPALTSLSAVLGKGELILTEEIMSLPRSLTKLEIGDWTLPSSTWPFLPDNLLELSFCVTNAHCTATIILVDPTTGEDELVDICPIDLLPKSLTKIHIGGHYCGTDFFVSGSSLSLFPPHLKSFDAPYLILAPNAAKQLPSSLTHLCTRSFYEQLSEHLPKGLTSLTSHNALLSPKAIKCLPKSLTKLCSFLSTSYSGEGEWFDYTTGKIVLSSFLPEYPIHLDYASYLASLPTNLTSLDLYHYSELGTDFMECRFPNLLRLALWGPKLTDASIPLLNRHLTFLQLRPAENITGKSFKDLPKSLTFLGLDTSSSIFDEDIQHLPRTLKFIGIRSATQLSDACVRDFPRGCKQINIRNNTLITPLCVPDLPLTMSSCQRAFSVGKWTLSCGKVFLREED